MFELDSVSLRVMNLNFLADQRTVTSSEGELRSSLLRSVIVFNLAIDGFHVRFYHDAIVGVRVVV